MNRIRIDGTFRRAWPGATGSAPYPADDVARVTVWFRGSADARIEAAAAERIGATPVRERTYESRRAYAARTGVDGRVTHAFERYCVERGLAIEARHWRSIVVAGRLDDLVTAFGASVDIRLSPNGDSFRHRHGWLDAPAHLAGDIAGAFGFHKWYPTARVIDPRRDRRPMRPRELERHYAFPDTTGAGQTIGLVAYETSYVESDYALAMRHLGIEREAPIVAHVDGERARARAERGADLEAATDVQIAAALAPGARIVVYEAPHDERGCLDAIRAAIFDDVHAPAVLSISYGIVERHWTQAALALLDDLFVAAAAIGVTVFVASGDNAAELDDERRPHVNAPASSPFVLACGATTIDGDAGEAAWHRSGGGFGRAGVPAWQSVARDWAERSGFPPGRGVPDVAAQCEPGYPVFFRGEELAMHGTSAVAPMWSALAARIDETTTGRYGVARTIGFFAPLLYANARATMTPVVRGGNVTFAAHAHWNPCAGLGTPNGIALQRLLAG